MKNNRVSAPPCVRYLLINSSLFMKLSLFLTLVVTLQVNALTFGQKITYHKENIKLTSFLKEIEKMSGYNIFYDHALIPENAMLNVAFKEAHFEDVLKQVLRNHQLEYKIIDKSIILSEKKSVKIKLQGNTTNLIKPIKGKILDNLGLPLIGVSIKEKGKPNGVMSDANGEFTIQVDEQSILVFTYIGFETKEILIGKQTKLNIILESSSESLSEVVVVGYGVQKKVNLTGAVSSINFEKESKSRPLTSVSNALAGLVPGLQAMQSSGQPNSDNSTLRIRGTGTLNSSAPLVLIDGMEQTFNDINPADVESISVLKDAASASIYGNRAANGVILITTKKGKIGSTDISLRSLYSFNQPSNLIELVNNSARYMELMNESSINVGQSLIYTKATIDKWREAEANPNGISAKGYPNYVAYPNTDWYKSVFQNKLMHDQTLSARGATDKVNYSLSATFLDNPGLINGAGLEKVYLRSNITMNVNKWLTIGNRTYGFQNDVGRNSTGSTLGGIGFTKVVPSIYPYYDGKYGAPEPREEDPQSHNALWDIESTGGSYTYSQINSSLFTDVKLAKNLVYHATYDWTRYWREDTYTTKSLGKYSFSQDQTVIAPMPADQLSSMFYATGDKRWRLEQNLTYNITLGRNEFSTLIGFEEMRKTNYNIDAQKTGLIDETITDLSTATTMKVISGMNAGFSARSYFGRLNYAFDSKYLLELNMRYDGSSRFSPVKRWGAFPSLSGGWRLSKESFMKNVKFINDLKIRGSWGKLGNNSIGNYEWQSTYATSNYSFGGTLNSGLAMTALANSNLRWESTAITNLGIDVTLLNSRLNTVIDVYNKKTDGILYRPNIYATMGNMTAPYENIAEVTNRGVEFSLMYNKRKGEFKYNLTANFAYNQNRVTKYKGALERGWITDDKGNRVYNTNIGDVSTGGSTRILEGSMINEFYMLSTYKGSGNYFNTDGSVNIYGGPKDGMIRTGADMEWLQLMRDAGYTFYPNQSIGKNNIWYGDYIYADSNGDGIYGNAADNDFKKISSQPKYNIGFQAGFSYKNFDFSMNWVAALDFGIYWYTAGQNSSATIFGYAIPKAIADDHYFYDPANPLDSRQNLTSKNPRLTRNSGSSQNDAVSSLHLEKGDFIKLRNLTIGYTLPQQLTKKIKTKDIRIFLTGENLLNINKFNGMDPEMQTGMGYATMRQYAIGVNVNF